MKNRAGMSMWLATATIAVAIFMGVPAEAQVEAKHSGYVGSEVCADCHEDETKAWRGSHHELAWTPATNPHVLGDFDSTSFEYRNGVALFSQDNGTFFVEIDGPDGTKKTYPVVGVAGIEPLQQYLVDIGDGHIQALDIAWDIEKARWYHLYPDQDLPAGDGLHWTGPYKNWNARCAECHATGFAKNYDISTRQYRSRSAEIGVGCESCHGPGAVHAARARGGTQKPAGSNLTDKGFTIGFSADSPETEIQQCAGCHARREPFGDGNPQPGTPFHDAYRLALLSDGLYHADGQIRDEVYVYGSFLQSKMYEKGVRCSNCHDPHAAQLKAEGNAVCTQCHSPAGNDGFPSLRKALYDDPEHHFHEPGTPGAQCKSCHMIERVYMGIDGRRDHSFRVPRPDLSENIGTPNACNDCHRDKSAGWAASEIETRFPQSVHRGAHFGEVFGRAWNGDSVAPELLALAEHDGMPAIVRASALDNMRLTDDQALIARSAALLADESPPVRAAAVAVQRGASPVDRVQRLVPLLSDPVRSVRMAAAREFINAPIAGMPDAINAAYRNALSEWMDSLSAKADYPETHLAMGGTALAMRNIAAAEAAFREAVRLDPQQPAAWRMIVLILDAQGNRAGARQALDEALKLIPDNEMLIELNAQFQ